MRKTLLLPTIGLLSAMAVSAQPLPLQRVSLGSVEPVAKENKAPRTITASKALSQDVRIQRVEVAPGIYAKQLVREGQALPTLKPRTTSMKAAGSGFAESFEDWDYSTMPWLPEGWTALSMDADNENPWFTYAYNNLWISDGDGYSAACILLSSDYCDEWLITPEVTVEPGQQLSFLYFAQLFYMLSTDYVDWETYEYTDRVPAAYLQVLAKPVDADEWTLLYNFLDETEGKSCMELMMGDDYSFHPKTLSLAQFEGQTIQVAFEYVGTDGNTCAIDNVRIDMPQMECSYAFPAYSQFFGVTREMADLTYSIPVLPTYTPITWTNTTYEDEAEYLWEYTDADDNECVSTDTDLTVTYHPDYTNDFTTRNCLYYSPVLNASAEGWSTGNYTIYDYFQVGGRADWESDGTIYEIGLAAFDPNTDGYTIYTNDYSEKAEPIFGWNEDVDEFWTSYSFGSDPDDRGEGDYAILTHVFNVYVSPNSPLVFSKAWTHAYASGLNADAVLTLEVLPLVYDEEQWGYVMGDVIATAACSMADAVLQKEGGIRNYYSFDFNFDEPVVIDDTVCDQFVVRLGGFRNASEYFAPMQSWWDATDGMLHGWVQKEISYNGDARTSLTPMYYYTEGLQSFGIILDGCYPYLEAEADEVNVDVAGITTVALDSYYDASDLTVECEGEWPEWLKAEVSGRYADAALELATSSNEAAEVILTLSAPGVKKSIKVVNGTSSINSVETSSDSPVTDTYTLQGVKVNGDNLPAGVYLQRRADGSAVKTVIK
ncbi:MAG: choice-of-anchor J domain-containing protein [Bacteroidales bacterium]|nr:choice-of-anchor J domain-containing protein [Bacteroidales bacterium]